MPPNIFYQYKINSIQMVITSNENYYNILEYKEYTDSAKPEYIGDFVIDVDLQKLNPELYPTIGGGIEFHMRYLKPEWYNEEI